MWKSRVVRCRSVRNLLATNVNAIPSPQADPEFWQEHRANRYLGLVRKLYLPRINSIEYQRQNISLPYICSPPEHVLPQATVEYWAMFLIHHGWFGFRSDRPGPLMNIGSTIDSCEHLVDFIHDFGGSLYTPVIICGYRRQKVLFQSYMDTLPRFVNAVSQIRSPRQHEWELVKQWFKSSNEDRRMIQNEFRHARSSTHMSDYVDTFPKLAGILDSAMSISMLAPHATCRIHLAATHSDRSSLDAVRSFLLQQDLHGGAIVEKQPKSFCWQLNQTEYVLRVLHQVLPYLRKKKKEVEFALQLVGQDRSRRQEFFEIRGFRKEMSRLDEDGDRLAAAVARVKRKQYNRNLTPDEQQELELLQGNLTKHKLSLKVNKAKVRAREMLDDGAVLSSTTF